MCSVTAVLVKSADAQTGRPVDVTAFRGEQVMFECSGTQVSWFMARGTKIYDSAKTPDPWNTPKGNKYDIEGNYNLIIKNLDASSDGGTYQCDTNEDTTRLIPANLVVLGKYLCEIYRRNMSGVMLGN